MTSHPLARIFLATHPIASEVDAAALDAKLRDLHDTGHDAWPGVLVSPEVFAAYVAKRSPPDEDGADPIMQLDTLHARSLYIACACAGGSDVALQALETRYAAEIVAALAKIRMSPSLADEVRQRLRQKLFVATEGAPPRIASYDGRGNLGRWLSVAATREALNLIHKHQREVPAEEEMLEGIVSPQENQELQLIKHQYRAEFKAAFQEAFAALDAQQKTILRYYTSDGLNIDEIGAVCDVHRATVARWLEKIRHFLLDKTRESLMARIGVNRAEFESIMRLIESQLDVSMNRLLTEEDRE